MCSAVLFGTSAMQSHGQVPFAPAYANCEYQTDLKGYSIETETGVPGAGYVAAGSVVSPGSASNTAHFVAFDYGPHIVASRFYRESGYFISPVDIVRSPSGTFYITCQARRKDPFVGIAEASIHVFEVNAGGAVIRNVHSGAPAGAPLTDLFATHSLVHNGRLYICGWGDAPGSYPYDPTAGGNSGKQAMVLCVNVNTSTLVNQTFWNSTVPPPARPTSTWPCGCGCRRMDRSCW